MLIFEVKFGFSHVMADTKFSITRLNNENYFVWKYKIELLLIKEGLWDKITTDKPAQNIPEDWETKDNQARAIIGLSIEDSQLHHVRKAKNAKEAWTSLKSYHERSTLSNKVHLMRKICNLKVEEGGDVEGHVKDMTDLFQKLIDIGEVISDGWSVAMLLSSLPRSFDTLITALETRPEDDLTLSLVQSKLISEYRKRISSGGECDNNVKVLKVNSNMQKLKFKRLCFFCNEEGHVKSDCLHFKEWKSKKENADKTQKVNKVNQCGESQFLFLTAVSQPGWIIDSGATCHIVNDKSFFSSFDENHRENVNVANGETVKAEGRGSGVVCVINDDKVESFIKLTDVLFVPSIESNLVSVRRLTEIGYELNFKEKICEIKLKGRNLAVADASTNLYKLRQPNKKALAAITHHNNNCIHYWHRVLGHRDPEVVKSLDSQLLVSGVKLVNCGVKCYCEVCLLGKMTRLPFPRSEIRTKQPLDLVHTDVCGPMQTVSPSGKRYMVTFIDDFSRYTVVYLLTHKSEVFGKMKEYIEMVKTKFSRKVKVFRSDRGGEYIGNEVTTYLKKEGIQVQYTAAYTPEQNGVAERKNRTLIEMARCMLLDADLGYRFWAEAVMTANYIQNRLPTRPIQVTPYEGWNDSKPDLKHFKIFGSKCFVHVPAAKRRKLDNRADSMIFVGYDNQSKAYRCWNPVTDRIVISRDVRFKMPGFDEDTVDDLTCEKEVDQCEDKVIGELSEEKVEISDCADDESDFEGFEDANDFESAEAPRRSERANKGIPPERLINEINIIEKIEEPKSLKEVMSSKYKKEWLQSMKEEMESLKENNTWILSDLPEGKKAIGCKWVFKVKTNVDGVHRFKARLVAQGFSQKYGSDYDEIFAPVVKQTTFRTLLAVAAKEKMFVEHMDVKTAFLNGELLEEIYMKQPPGFEIENGDKKVCLLQRSLYGLKQAARTWNKTIHDILISRGFQQSRADFCLYSLKKDDCWCFVLIYVDDLIFACKKKDVMLEEEQFLKSKFKMVNLGEIKQYLGLEVSKDQHGNLE